MKKGFLFFVCLGLYGSVCLGQNEKYVKAMEANIAAMDTSHAMESLQKVSNVFERIGGKEAKEWLPNYYVAYCQAMMVNFEPNTEKWGDFCDKGDKFIALADSLNPHNSEVEVVKSMLAGARIRINPMMNGMKYGGIANQAIEKAIMLNAENPRAYLQRGISLFYTPEMFGGGKDKAMPVLEMAGKKLAAFKPASSIEPNWGKGAYDFIMGEASK